MNRRRRSGWFGLILGLTGICFALPQSALAAGLFTPGNIHTTIEAGQSTTGTIAIANPLSSLETASIEVDELTTDEHGKLGVQKPTSSTFWGTSAIHVSAGQQTVGGNGTASFDYTITIPSDAQSADQLAAIVITTKHANFPTIYVAIPVWVVITRPGEVAPSISSSSSLPAGAITVVNSVTSSVAELQSTTETTTTSPTSATPSVKSSQAQAVTTPAPAPALTAPSAEPEINYTIDDFRSPLFAFATPKQTLTFRNTGRRVVPVAAATISYQSFGQQLLGQTTAQESLLLPGTVRTHTVIVPKLFFQTRFGKFPFIGGILSTTLTPLGGEALQARTYVIPWWFLSLMLALVFALVAKIAAYHPMAPHKHMVFRYQGRLSFASLIAMVAFVQYFSQSGWVSIVRADGSSVTQNVTVAATTSYTVTANDTATVMTFQLNQVIQVIAGGQVYTVNLGDGALSLPPNVDIVVITPFSSN